MANVNEKLQKAIAQFDLLTVKREYPAKNPAPITKHIVSHQASEQQVIELFRMKVLSLLEKYGLASNPEARIQVIQAPILKNIGDDAFRCTLSQTITLFPGQTITITGTSALDPKTAKINVLFPDTFTLMLESKQPGFPHPLQRSGWALAYPLIVDSPEHSPYLTIPPEFFAKKQEAMILLHPEGSGIHQAKKMMKLKCEAFSKHRTELLSLHRERAHAMMKASNSENKNHKCIDNYYDLLIDEKNPFEFLSKTYQLLNDHFIVSPHQQLLQSITLSKIQEIVDQDSYPQPICFDQVLEESLEKNQLLVLKNKENNPSTLDMAKYDYVYSLGSLIGKSSQRIILQNLTDTHNFPLPYLEKFDKLIQFSAYSQSIDFFNDLENPVDSIESAYKNMQQSLYSDIKLFIHEKPSNFLEI